MAHVPRVVSPANRIVQRRGKESGHDVPFADEVISSGGTSVKNTSLGNLMFFINTRQPGETAEPSSLCGDKYRNKDNLFLCTTHHFENIFHFKNK
jgi:hypothetical protein